MSAFIDQERERFTVDLICRTLGVSPSAYYQRATGKRSARVVEDERLLERIREVHAANYYAYGSRRMWKALLRAGETVARGRVERLMRTNGIQGAKRRGKPWCTTTPDPDGHRRPDLVQRDFSAAQPDELWLADFTYLRCHEGVVFFSFVIGAYSRRIVGWQFASHATAPMTSPPSPTRSTPARARRSTGAHRPRSSTSTSPPQPDLRANVAIDPHPAPRRGTRQPFTLPAPVVTRYGGLTHNPVLRRPVEFGQYTNFDFTQTLDDHGILGSVGSTGDVYDNALAESFVDTFKTELITGRVWRTRTQLEFAVVEWVGWFNHERLHSEIGDIPPAKHEALYAAHTETSPSLT